MRIKTIRQQFPVKNYVLARYPVQFEYVPPHIRFISASSPHAAVIVEQVRHVRVGRLSNALAGPLLLLLGLRRHRRGLARVVARRLLPNAHQLAVHVIQARQLHAAPHGLELWLDGVVQRRVVGPHVPREVVLLRAHHQDLVLALQLRQRVLAVGPAVLEVLDRHPRSIRLALQMGQQRRGVLDSRNDGPVLVRARLPRLLAQARIRLPFHPRVPPQPLRQLLLVLLRVVPQTQVVDDVRDGLCVALLLQVLHRKRHLRLDLGTVSRQLRLRKRHFRSDIALPL